MVLVGIICFTGVGPAAENLVVFDREITVTDGVHHWPCAEGLPGDWTAPVDYTAGRLHIDWEIIEAPAGVEDFLLQIGWTFPWADSGAGKPHQLTRFKYQHLLFGERFRDRVPAAELPDEAQSPAWITGARWHTVHVMGSGRFFWPLPEKEPKDFSQGIAGIKAFSRDAAWQVRGPPAPVRMRVTMTVVPPGGTYRPPTSFGGLDPHELTELPAVREALLERQPGRALALVEGLGGDVLAEAARRQLTLAETALLDHLATERSAVEQLFADDPLAGLEALASLADTFSASRQSDELVALGRAWMKTAAVERERQAEPLYRQAVAVLDQVAAEAEGPLSDPAVQRAHQRALRKVVQCHQRLGKRYGDSVAFRKLERLLVAKGLVAEAEVTSDSR